MSSNRKKIRIFGAAALMLASSMAAEAGKVSMHLNGVPQGEWEQKARRTQEAREHNGKGCSLSSALKPEESLRAFNEAIDFRGDMPLGTPSTTPKALPRTSLTKSAADYTQEITTLCNKATDLINGKDFTAALDVYEKVIERKPDSAAAYNNKGNILLELGRPEEAVAVYEKAIELQSDSAEIYNNKARSLSKLERYEEAVPVFDKAIELDPHFAESYKNKAYSLAKLGRHEEAVQTYDKVISLKPDFAHCYYNKGCALQDLGRDQEAIPSFEQAVELNKDLRNGPRALQALGEVVQIHTQGTQTSLSMLSEFGVSTQTENESKEIGVQVSSSMTSAFAQTDNVQSKEALVQTYSSSIGATEIATQTERDIRDQAVQTVKVAPEIKDMVIMATQTESIQEKVQEKSEQVSVSTSTDDLYELEGDLSNDRVLNWDLDSNLSTDLDSLSDSESNYSSYDASIVDESEQDTQSAENQESQAVELQDGTSQADSDSELRELDFINTASNQLQESQTDLTHNQQTKDNQDVQSRKQEEVTKVLEETSRAGATLASTGNGIACNILNSISQRLNLNSMAAVAAGDEEEQAELIGPNTGFFISPFVSKTNAKEFKSTSRYNGRSKGYTVGFDSKVNDLLLLGMSYTKADSSINFKQNHLGDQALIDSNFYSLYGQLMPQHQKFFLSTIAIYGKSDISSKARRGSGGTALGRHKAYSNILEVLVGSSQKFWQQFSITPQLGLKYSRTKDAAYTERSNIGTPSLIVGRVKVKALEAIAGLKVDYRYNMGRDITLIPELYGFASKRLHSKAPLIRTKLQLDADTIVLPDIRASDSKLDLSYGARVSVRAKNVDISAGYHSVKARKLISHAGSLKVKINL